MAYIEIRNVPVPEGRQAASKAELVFPNFTPELAGRWRARQTKTVKPDGDVAWFLQQLLEIVPSLSDITTQRAIYYMLRGKFPDKEFRSTRATMPLSSDNFYTWLTGQGMEKLQLVVGLTMQSMGIWAAPRGYIAGDGRIYTTRRGNIPLTAQPTLSFDLADVGTSLATHARKVIHFEKDAGFASLVAGDMPRYLEACFSTSQGQLSEAASKFLASAEKWGLRVYCVHDADGWGLMMQLLYGLASKSNCYMPTEFYPQGVRSLGFFPTIASTLKLPPETLTEKELSLEGNLREMATEHRELEKEVNTLISSQHKWEFQALSAIHEKAPQIYLVESLRAVDDEIKYVPDGATIRKQVSAEAKQTAGSLVEDAIDKAADEVLASVKDGLKAEIRGRLASQIEDYTKRVDKVIEAVGAVDPLAYREAVKQRLVADPALYWDSAARSLARDSFKLEFEVKADVEVLTDVRSVDVVEATAEASPPTVPDKRLDKDDIIRAIESRILRKQAEREKVVRPIRKAFESVMGTPNLDW